jgi:hypothetical protein
MATLNELVGILGVDPVRTIGGQVYDSMINTPSQNINLGADTFAPDITPYSDNRDSMYSGLMSVSKPVRDTFNKYSSKIAGGLFGLATGIPGANFLFNAFGRANQPNVPNPLAQGVYTDPNTGFFRDKFGYNVGPTILQSNFLQPGSSSFRSYALEGLRGLDPVAANQFYQQTYGKSFDEVKKDIQRKQNPFGPQDPNIGTSDYQGGGDSGGNIEGSVSPGGTDDTPGTPF